MTTNATQRISISQDGVWAGSGRLVNGTIEDCAAILGPSGLDHEDGSAQAAAERAYDAIQEAIAADKESCECDGCKYEWEITDAE